MTNIHLFSLVMNVIFLTSTFAQFCGCQSYPLESAQRKCYKVAALSWLAAVEVETAEKEVGYEDTDERGCPERGAEECILYIAFLRFILYLQVLHFVFLFFIFRYHPPTCWSMNIIFSIRGFVKNHNGWVFERIGKEEGKSILEFYTGKTDDEWLLHRGTSLKSLNSCNIHHPAP